MGVCVRVRERERDEDIETGERKSKYNTQNSFSVPNRGGGKVMKRIYQVLKLQ